MLLLEKVRCKSLVGLGGNLGEIVNFVGRMREAWFFFDARALRRLFKDWRWRDEDC